MNLLVLQEASTHIIQPEFNPAVAESLQFLLKLLSVVVLSTLQGWGHTSGCFSPGLDLQWQLLDKVRGWSMEMKIQRWCVHDPRDAQVPMPLVTTLFVVPRADYWLLLVDFCVLNKIKKLEYLTEIKTKDTSRDYESFHKGKQKGKHYFFSNFTYIWLFLNL